VCNKSELAVCRRREDGTVSKECISRPEGIRQGKQSHNWALRQILKQDRSLDTPVTAEDLQALRDGITSIEGEEIRFTLPEDMADTIGP
jgi:hypothetical protein